MLKLQESPLHCGPDQPRIQTGVLDHSLVCLLIRLHRSLVPSLAHFAHSLARGTENDCMAILSVFFSIFDHSVRLDKKIFARLPLIEFGELEKFSR